MTRMFDTIIMALLIIAVVICAAAAYSDVSDRQASQEMIDAANSHDNTVVVYYTVSEPDGVMQNLQLGLREIDPAEFKLGSDE